LKCSTFKINMILYIMTFREDNVAMLEIAAFLLQLEVRSWNYKVIYF
jgi:hypothetical protein